MKSERTQAIVLRRTNYAEADRIVQLITPIGRRSVMARGVRREKSRLAGGIELFAISDVVIGKGKGELGILTSARTTELLHDILKDYDRLQFGYEVIKQVARASELVDEPEWYEVLLETLKGLNDTEVNFLLIQTWFYLRHSALLGHELSLYRDVMGRALSPSETYAYDVAEQGFRSVADGSLDKEHIKLLRLIGVKPLSVISQVGGIKDVVAECLYVARQHASL